MNDVILVSKDGDEFKISREEAYCSGFLRTILENPNFLESQEGKIHLREITTEILTVVVRYFRYRVENPSKTLGAKDFDVEPKLLFGLMNAAAFMDC